MRSASQDGAARSGDDVRKEPLATATLPVLAFLAFWLVVVDGNPASSVMLRKCSWESARAGAGGQSCPCSLPIVYPPPPPLPLPLPLPFPLRVHFCVLGDARCCSHSTSVTIRNALILYPASDHSIHFPWVKSQRHVKLFAPAQLGDLDKVTDTLAVDSIYSLPRLDSSP